jgi:hypothetical protein
MLVYQSTGTCNEPILYVVYQSTGTCNEPILYVSSV